jgi:hypothetical protein
MTRYDAPVIALVVDVEDPEQLGRIKVKFPWLAADGTTTAWAPIVRPLAGSDRGFYYTPEVDDEAVVAFQFGDFNHPIVLGFLHNGVDKPPTTGIDTNVRRLRTVSGHQLEFDDRSDSESVRLTSRSGHQLELHDDSGYVEVRTTGGQKIRMDDMPGRIELSTPGGTTVTMDDVPSSIRLTTAGGVTLTISDAGGVSVSAPAGAVSVSALTAEVSSTAGLSLKAPVVSVDAVMANFTGIVNCTTLITQSVVSPLYTPGAGNIW